MHVVRVTRLPWAVCRSAARAVRRAERGRHAIDVLNPPGISGFFRSRPPLAVLLYLAGQDGLLLWRGLDAFAVLKPPSSTSPGQSSGPRLIRVLRWVDRWWNVLVFAVPPGCLLAIATALLPEPRFWLVAGVLALAAALYVTLMMAAGVATAAWHTYRRIETSDSLPAQVTGDELIRRHWAMVLCHVSDPTTVASLVAAARRHTDETRQTGHEPPRGSELLVCPERGFTTATASAVAATLPSAVRLPGRQPIIVIGHTGFRAPKVDDPGSPRGITFLLAGALAVFGLEGVVVTILERQACADSCVGGLNRYPDALYWLLSHLVLLGDPEGLAPAATGTKMIGLLTPIAGLVLVAAVAVATWRYMAGSAHAVRAVYESLERPPTVGIMTALPEEYNAVLALLDNVVDRQVAADGTTYAFGTLPSVVAGTNHDVVLAMTTSTGNDAAAVACTNLATNFPTVNCVIMSGIAAGVPNPQEPDKHVRLGDVVVATWGVVDYDHVDETPTGRRLRGGFPRLSSWLTRATKQLEAAEQRGLRPWERWLDLALRALPQHTRPDEDADVLFLGDDTDARRPHPDPHLSGHRAGRPNVHQGRIGSANRSLRNARVRDAFATAYDLRAFEMESSGIGTGSYLGGLEWFVVRGISDYGDSRTGKAWRGYAAIAAAAYVRALLGAAPPIDPRGGHPRGGPAIEPGGDEDAHHRRLRRP